VLQAYNRRALRRNVEQSRALRYPDSGSDSEQDEPFPKVRRLKPRRHRPPRVTDSNALLEKEFCKDDRCVETCLPSFPGLPFIAFASLKEYESFRSGRLTPKRVPTNGNTLSEHQDAEGIANQRKASPTRVPKRVTRRNSASTDQQKALSVKDEELEKENSDGPLLETGQGFFPSKCDYNPDTESGDSLYSDSTEYFRPHSATLRDKLPAEVKKTKRKRKPTKRSRQSTKLSVKKEPRDLMDARLHQQVLTYQHHHQHSHHHTMALPLVVNPLGVNWSPFAIQLNDPLVMASLHTAHQVALHKPLQSAPSGKWNSMHARIARFIYQEQQKVKSKENGNTKEPESEQATPETSRTRSRKESKRKKAALSNRSGSVPSAFASIVSPSIAEGSRTLWDRQFIPNPNFPHFQRFNHL